MKKKITQSFRLRHGAKVAKVEPATKVVGARVYEDEYERYQALADAKGESMTEFLRRVLEAEYERVTRRRSG